MRIRLCSDIHTEFYKKELTNDEIEAILPSKESDSKSILVLAGDIGKVKAHNTLKSFLDSVCGRFYKVIMVLGNHEYYSGNYGTVPKKLMSYMEQDNFILLNDDVYVEDDIRFIGSTLWANCNNRNPTEVYNVSSSMNDFRRIRIGPISEPWKKKFEVNDMINCFERHVSFLTNELRKPFTGKTIVITHHGPTYRSVGPKHISSKINGAYVSDLSDLILDNDIAFWLHGHVHSSCDYMVGDTNVIVNPRGYPRTDGGCENLSYNSEMIIDC